MKQCSVSKKIIKDGKEVIVCDDTRAQLLAVLQKIQDEQGFIAEQDMQDVAARFDIHPVEVYSVVTFYSFLTTQKLGKHILQVSTCASCECAGSAQLIAALEKALGVKAGETTPDGEFTLKKVSCIGMCDHAPAVLVDGHLVGGITPDMAETLITECRQGKIPLSGEYRPQQDKRQGELLFSHIEPYAGLKKALQIGRSAVLDEVRDSGIKGRGGAGFPVGVKWNLAATAQSETKYVVCNADEGEPGTFKDRVLLTEYARQVFEGMAIAGFAIGATHGLMYLRGEYAGFVPELEKALEQMRKDNALGVNIMGQDFGFEIEIRLGSGAYVCGEETALIESLEGYRGEPRNRPPFPVNTGYVGDPTVVNNVETSVAVVHIVSKGAQVFKKIGTEKSTGTKLISVSGDCRKPGVYEIPFGTSINDILKMVEADKPQAVQVGGASGTCLAPKDFNRTIAFEDVPTGGSVMIFNQERNMLGIARNFLEFFEEESCGQCTPCREGIPVLLEMHDKIVRGDFTESDRSKLASLAETMQLASKCGLGQSSPNAFLAIIQNFTK